MNIMASLIPHIREREETIQENGGRVNTIGGKLKDSVCGGGSKAAKTERQSV